MSTFSRFSMMARLDLLSLQVARTLAVGERPGNSSDHVPREVTPYPRPAHLPDHAGRQRLGRQADINSPASAGIALDLEGATVPLDQHLGDEQSQSSALVTLGHDVLEAEERVQDVGSDIPDVSWSAILNHDVQSRSASADLYSNAAVVRGGFDSLTQNVDQHLLQATSVRRQDG